MAQQIAHNLDESRQTHNVFPEAHNGSGQQVLQDAKSTSEAGQSSHVANPTMATEKVPFVFASEPVMSNQTNGNNDSRNNTLEGDQYSRGQIIILNKKRMLMKIRHVKKLHGRNCLERTDIQTKANVCVKICVAVMRYISRRILSPLRMLRGFSVLLDIFLADSRVKMRFINYVRARRYKPHSISMLVISGLSFSLSINIIVMVCHCLDTILFLDVSCMYVQFPSSSRLMLTRCVLCQYGNLSQFTFRALD